MIVRLDRAGNIRNSTVVEADQLDLCDPASDEDGALPTELQIRRDTNEDEIDVFRFGQETRSTSCLAKARRWPSTGSDKQKNIAG